MAKAKRGKGGRFVRAGRSIKRRVKGMFNLGRGAHSPGIMGALERPVSRVLAPAIGLSAIAQLFLVPLPNGDSVVGRLVSAYTSMKNGDQAGAQVAIAGDGGANTGIGPVLVAQVQQNAFGAILTGIGAGVVGYVGRKLGV